MTRIAVDVEGVSKRFRIYHERNQSLKAAVLRGGRAKYDDFWALRDITFSVHEGETFALIGDNGSGKSTLLKCLAGILTPDRGGIEARGSIAALLELGSGFHPELSGRENVYLNGSILGLSRREIDATFDEIVDFSGIHAFIDQPVKNYSSGMYVRLAFSVAIHVDPDILLVDEVLAVGDAAFQEKCLAKFADYRDAGKTVVVVSHALGLVRAMADRAVLLEDGAVAGIGRPAELLDRYVDEHHAREEDASGQVRLGSGEISIEQVELLADGRSTRSVGWGDQLTIRVRFRARERVRRPVIALGLYTMSGVHVWGSNLRDADQVPESFLGEGLAEYHIPAVVLRPGRYQLNVAAHDYTFSHTYDYIRGIRVLDVRHGQGNAGGGVVEFGGRWMITSSDSK